MEFYAVLAMLCFNIILHLIEINKPKPLTFLELFNFIYDQREEIIKILKEESKEMSRQLFDNYLKISDVIKRKKDEI